ncbi:MAG TPA: hypothetical protein VN600_07960 [Gemmatimonadaceae bacterium]|jgi:hypothetical protein|nr:hypothetical protein [Gemmatimonadaceae bacterium]
MPSFFPAHTLEIRHDEPGALRRFSFSLVEMAVVTGVLVRVFRLLVLTHGSNNWLYLGGVFALGIIVLLGMLTAHLANYPLHQYLWRAPAFAAVEVAAEMAASALLIWLGREPWGPVRAHWDDWVGMGLNTLLTRGLAIVIWGLILAGVVQLVRRTIVHEDDEPTEAPAR